MSDIAVVAADDDNRLAAAGAWAPARLSVGFWRRRAGGVAEIPHSDGASVFSLATGLVAKRQAQRSGLCSEAQYLRLLGRHLERHRARNARRVFVGVGFLVDTENPHVLKQKVRTEIVIVGGTIGIF